MQQCGFDLVSPLAANDVIVMILYATIASSPSKDSSVRSGGFSSVFDLSVRFFMGQSDLSTSPPCTKVVDRQPWVRGCINLSFENLL